MGFFNCIPLFFEFLGQNEIPATKTRSFYHCLLLAVVVASLFFASPSLAKVNVGEEPQIEFGQLENFTPISQSKSSVFERLRVLTNNFSSDDSLLEFSQSLFSEFTAAELDSLTDGVGEAELHSLYLDLRNSGIEFQSIGDLHRGIRLAGYSVVGDQHAGLIKIGVIFSAVAVVFFDWRAFNAAPASGFVCNDSDYDDQNGDCDHHSGRFIRGLLRDWGYSYTPFIWRYYPSYDPYYPE